MLKREDFYEVNQKTLDKYYQNQKRTKKLYIYPHLNAIATAKPSAAVREYLYVEFSAYKSAFKRFLIKMYTKVVINSRGLLSSRTCKVGEEFTDDMLIYPCNKKIRIFDFAAGCVSVMGKHGFAGDGIQREIDFRAKNKADFIPELLSYTDEGYTERIIDGRPLARIAEHRDEYTDRALRLLRAFDNVGKSRKIADYAASLRADAEDLMQKCSEKSANLASAAKLAAKLYDELSASPDTIELGFSHGDLQPGNIWVENGSERIYIIDWESSGIRSLEYDYAALYRGLRTASGVEKIAESHSVTDMVILFEDLIYRLTELSSLPGDIGSAEFDNYVNAVLRKR